MSLPEDSSTKRAKPRLLVVEDDLTAARALDLIFQGEGWEVMTVATVAEAHEALEVFKPVWMILDLMLPDGDGREVLEELRRKNGLTMVAVASGVSDPERLAGVRALRPELMVKKPVDIFELIPKLAI